MKTYIKFLSKIFLSSFVYFSLIMFSLIFILNLLSELDFFKDINVNSYYPVYLSLLNSPTFIFEMFPFIFLISTNFFSSHYLIMINLVFLSILVLKIQKFYLLSVLRVLF